MTALVIEQEGKIREAFSYERPLMETTHHALLEYARATYGADAKVRPMTELQTGNPIFLQAAICKDKSTCSSDPTAATILGDE